MNRRRRRRRVPRTGNTENSWRECWTLEQHAREFKRDVAVSAFKANCTNADGIREAANGGRAEPFFLNYSMFPAAWNTHRLFPIGSSRITLDNVAAKSIDSLDGSWVKRPRNRENQNDRKGRGDKVGQRDKKIASGDCSMEMRSWKHE